MRKVYNTLTACAVTLSVLLAGCGTPSGQTEGGTMKGKKSKGFTEERLTAEEREARQFTPEVMWKMGRIGGFALSPDGTRVAYTVTRYSVKDNASRTAVYVQGINEKQGTLVAEEGSSPKWIGNGTAIAFLRSVDGVTQLFSVQPDGSAATQLTKFSQDINAFWVSPDGKQLLYASTVQVEKTTEDRYPGMDKANVRIIDSLMYRHWNYWTEGKYSHLFLTEFQGENTAWGNDLMVGEAWDCPMAPYFDDAEVAWAADSKSFFYTCKKSMGREYATTTNSNIYRYFLENGNTEVLTADNKGYDKLPVVSPDGTKLLWQRMETPGYESDRARLMCMDLTDKRVTELMADYDQNADSYSWAADGASINVISGLNGTEQLFSLDVATKQLTQVTKGQFDINWAAPIEGGYLVQRTQLNKGAELYKYVGGEFTPFTGINDDIYASVDLSEVRGRWIETTNGEKMLTWVVLPPNFDSTKKYPALLYCQGGPQSTVSQFWSYRWNIQLMAAQGYVVVCPNRHGVPSFGQAWNLQISGDYSGQNIKDYLTAIDAVSKESWVDETRLGCVGASYGGYSVYYLAGVHEGRFKAFIAHNGMFNFESFYAGTEETFFPNHDFGGAYWDKKNATAQRSYANSPHRLVDKWDTPILIIVGEHDFRIPYTEGLQAFNAAQLRGVPARLLVYPEETHFVSSPQNSIIWQHEFFGWLDRWLKN